MKLTRQDFQLYDASYHDDWTQVWIKKRHFKKKYWLFGELVPTNEFNFIISYVEPLEFDSKETAEKYINTLL